MQNFQDLSIETKSKLLLDFIQLIQDKVYNLFEYLDYCIPLEDLDSTDGRYDNAYEDARQHLLNNEDWDYEFVFKSRFFEYLLTNSNLKIFIEKSLDYFSLYNVNDYNIIKNYIKTLFINLSLSINYVNILFNENEKRFIYKHKIEEDFIKKPDYIRENEYLVIVNDQLPNSQVDLFYLQPDNFDDFGFKTKYTLFYINTKGTKEVVGNLKILNINETITKDCLKENFYNLSLDYCSRGDDLTYYKNLQRILDNNFENFLYSIRDVIIFPTIMEIYESYEGYQNSLLRISNETINMLGGIKRIKEIRQILNKEEMSSNFDFNFKSNYSTNSIKLKFNFENQVNFKKSNQNSLRRIYTIIGKNGVGKTQLLNLIAKSFKEKNRENFSNSMPIFSKIITISYSYFDSFEIPEKDAFFNYQYFGLRKKTDDKIHHQERDQLTIDLLENLKLLQTKGYFNISKLIDFLKLIITESIINNIFKGDIENTFQLPVAEALKILIDKLSSGELITFLFITNLFCSIKPNALILIDEPETHLHPNAIKNLINIIFEIVDKFESFCIISTHSPIIIQELQASNVIILDRTDDHIFQRFLDYDTLGESLHIITNDIFGNYNIPKHYVKYIDELIGEGIHKTELESYLKSKDLPLSFALKMLINSKFEEKYV